MAPEAERKDWSTPAPGSVEGMSEEAIALMQNILAGDLSGLETANDDVAWEVNAYFGRIAGAVGNAIHFKNVRRNPRLWGAERRS